MNDDPRPLGERLRDLRQSRGMSLSRVERDTDGKYKAVVVGSWERDQRHVVLDKADQYLRDVHGCRLEFVPLDLTDEHLALAAWLAPEGVTAVEARAAVDLIRATRVQQGVPVLRSVA